MKELRWLFLIGSFILALFAFGFNQFGETAKSNNALLLAILLMLSAIYNKIEARP